MTFGVALELLKQGSKVTRKGWNGKNMFLLLQDGGKVPGNAMRNKAARDFYKDQEVTICPHIDMKAANGEYVVGWLASQTDMLAEDWELYNEEQTLQDHDIRAMEYAMKKQEEINGTQSNQ